MEGNSHNEDGSPSQSVMSFAAAVRFHNMMLLL